jgi:hypothetical protein
VTGLASVLCGAVALSADAPDLPTVDGPETDGLVKELTGLLVHPEPVGGILATVLPSLEKKTVRPPGKHAPVSDMSGPDREGRIAVVESRRGTVALRLVRDAGSEGKEVLQRPGTGFLSRTIGRPAISPEDAYVAFVAGTRSVSMPVEPKVTLREGTLEVWKAGEGRRLEFEGELKAIDRSLAWLPAGKVLIYSALVGPNTLPEALLNEYIRVSGSRGVIPLVERKVPAVHRLEVPGGKPVPVCVGRRSVVSQDGKAILVQGIGFEWMLHDVTTGRLKPAKLPGLYDRDRLGIYEGGAIALLEGNIVIYWGLPTTGAVQRTTTSNSPLVGAKKMPSIKAARLSSGEFQTIIPSMDPRHEVLFGQVIATK